MDNTAERGIAELTEASSARPPASARFINPETVHPPFGYTHLPVIREVRDQYLNTRQPPASTAVEVRRLFREDALIEVEAVAVIAPTEPSGR